MIFLRQSTASQEIPLDRFVDSTDGNTEETALTIANTDIKLWKTGATTLASKNSGGATHIANGVYYCVLDATDTDTIGPMVVTVHVAGALAVRVPCTVLDEAVYDSLFGTTALSTYAGGAVASVTGNVGGNVSGSVGSIASGGITSASFAAGAIDAAAIAADAIGSSELAASAVTEIQSGLATSASISALNNLSQADVRTAVGLATGNLDTQLTAIDDFLDTEIAAIKAKTDNLPSDPADASDIAALLSAISSSLSTISTNITTLTGYVDTEVASILAAVDTEVAAIKAKTDSLTFTVAGQVDANVQAVNDTSLTGDGSSGTPWGPA